MEKIILYSTGCPMCTVVEKKMKNKNIDYDICNDIDEMIKLKIKKVPVLKVGDVLMDFETAIKYINDFKAL